MELEQLTQEVIADADLGGELAGERQRHGRELVEHGHERITIDDGERGGPVRHNRKRLGIAGEQRERAEPIAGRHPTAQRAPALGDLDVDLAADDHDEPRARGGVAVALAGGEADDREAARDPTDLIGPKLLEDRQVREHQLELRHAPRAYLASPRVRARRARLPGSRAAPTRGSDRPPLQVRGASRSRTRRWVAADAESSVSPMAPTYR